ncbi:MAG: protein kinase [Thermoanaerobaculaceae bacterium]
MAESVSPERPTASWKPTLGAGAAPARAPVALPAPGQVLGGRFVLGQVLGSGASGMVYSAFDERLGQKVAIKVVLPHLVDEATRQRLRREVQAARQAHPNVVGVYDLHEADGFVFLSMELVEGGGLRGLLTEKGRLGADETVALGRQLAAALAHFHALGLVHRDVKPGNILIAPDGTAKLCDLGLTRALQHGDTVTESAMLMGTPAYMAPEQGLHPEVSPAADVYALGLTLWECLSGEVPLKGDTALDTLMRRQKLAPRPLRGSVPGCPPWLDRLLRQMLDPDPARRPTAARVEQALTSGRAPFRLPRRALAAAALVVVAVSASLLGWRAVEGRRTTRLEGVGQTVHGLDSRGRSRWEYTTASTIRQTERADVDGDGRPDLIVSAYPSFQERSDPASKLVPEVLVVGEDGRLLTRARPEELIPGWPHPFNRQLDCAAIARDLDDDGAAEVLLNCIHPTFYPTELLLYRPREDRWEWVLDHTGHIYDILPLPDPRTPRLRLFAVNNRLAMLPVAAELAINPASSRRMGAVEAVPLASPDRGMGLGGSSRWLAYVPLPQAEAEARWLVAGRPGVWSDPEGGWGIVLDGGHEARLDRLHNPQPGPNAGRDLEETRLAFFQHLQGFAPRTQPATPSEVRELARDVAGQIAPLLDEAPYRAIFALAVARALARARDPEGAAAFLGAEAPPDPPEDLVYRLAHLEAVAARLDRASASLAPMVRAPRTPRGSYDARLLLVRVAVEARDVATVRMCAEKVAEWSTESAQQATLTATARARAWLWWDETPTAGAAIRSTPYLPEGDALAVLLRWRHDQIAEGDVEAMRQLAKAAPETAAESQVAMAAALLGQGRPSEAIDTLESLIETLEYDARDDFANRQTLDLARAVRVKALAAVRRPSAVTEAAALVRRLTPGLLPSILAREVASPPGPRPSGSARQG